MRIFAALLAFLFSASLALAQVPPPVPGLPDAPRIATVTLNNSTGPVPVPFALYGDGSDYGNWIEVWLNNVLETPPTWTLTSPSGSIGNIARPITNAQVTFANPQSGTVTIVGARRPRRTSQFQENQGVPARDLNVVLTDLVSQNRETWDKLNDVSGRAILGLPGESIGLMPPASQRAGMALGFDSTGNKIVMSPVAASGVSSVFGRFGAVTAQPNDYQFNQIGGQVAFTQFPQIASPTLMGNVSGSPTTPSALTTLQVQAFCLLFTPVTKGCVPASDTDLTHFLRSDGTWTAPPTAAVIDVFGRVGHIVGAQGDYNFSQISGQTTLGQLPTIPDQSVIGNISGSPGIPSALSKAQLTTLCNIFTASIAGCVPSSSGGTVNFLRADGTWSPPPPFTCVIFSTSVPGCVPVSPGGTVSYLRADGNWSVPPGSGGTGGNITLGSTTITGGTSLRVLYDQGGVVQEYTNAQLTALCNLFTTAGVSGCVPGSTGNTGQFLRADGIWTAPPAGAVTQVFGRTGSIVATANDYSFAQLSGQAALTQLPTIGASTVLGSVGGGTPVALSPTTLQTFCQPFASATKGCVPSSGGGTTNFLRADGTWASPTGSGTTIIVGSTPISGGAANGILFDTGGTTGEIPAISGDGTLNTTTGALTITKTQGASFGSAALQDLATVANFTGGAANKVLTAATVYTAEVAVTWGATTVFDFSTFLNASVTLTGNITTMTWSGMKAGQAGLLRFIQDGTGNRTIPATVNSNLKCAGGCNYVLSTAASAVDIIPYQCIATNYCIGGALLKGVQ